MIVTVGFFSSLFKYLLHYRYQKENLRERDHLVDPGLDWRIILRWIFRKWDMGVWTRLSWLRIETGCWHL
jgi:hypothetical protein